MAQKRQSNGWEPPSKRQQSDNGFSKPSNNGGYRRPTSTPELPRISATYEDQVFTHQSALTAADNGNDTKSYDRLEFLGDAYIEVFASRLIWKRYPSLPTGKMSQLRESLVKNETLAELSSLYGFDLKLRGDVELQREQKRWVKIKGDMFEAYVAAVVLSDPINGFGIAEKWLVELWEPILPAETKLPDMQAKVQLSGKLGGKGVKISYVDEKPPSYSKGDQTYFVGAYLTGWGWDNQHLGSGKGSSKNAAGNDAAAKALQNMVLLAEIIAVRKAALADRISNDSKADLTG